MTTLLDIRWYELFASFYCRSCRHSVYLVTSFFSSNTTTWWISLLSHSRLPFLSSLTPPLPSYFHFPDSAIDHAAAVMHHQWPVMHAIPTWQTALSFYKINYFRVNYALHNLRDFGELCWASEGNPDMYFNAIFSVSEYFPVFSEMSAISINGWDFPTPIVLGHCQLWICSVTCRRRPYTDNFSTQNYCWTVYGSLLKDLSSVN